MTLFDTILAAAIVAAEQETNEALAGLAPFVPSDKVVLGRSAVTYRVTANRQGGRDGRDTYDVEVEATGSKPYTVTLNGDFTGWGTSLAEALADMRARVAEAAAEDAA